MSYCAEHNLNDTQGRGCIECLRAKLAEAVEAAFREGHAAGANDYFEASHGAGIINACKCWLASEAKARLT